MNISINGENVDILPSISLHLNQYKTNPNVFIKGLKPSRKEASKKISRMSVTFRP